MKSGYFRSVLSFSYSAGGPLPISILLHTDTHSLAIGTAKYLHKPLICSPRS
jgi:hypothetical protein